MGKADGVVTAVCTKCGRMQLDDKYYVEDGNAATHFIICDKCKK